MKLDSFLKLEGQEGVSTDGTHTKEFEIISFHHRIHRDATLAGEADAKRPPAATHGEVTAFMPLDANTPLLLKSICTSVQYATGTIVCRGAKLEGQAVKQTDLYKLTLKKVVITRVHYVANPVFHSFGRQNIPMASGRCAWLGPVTELELLYFGDITWDYAGVAKSATPNA